MMTDIIELAQNFEKTRYKSHDNINDARLLCRAVWRKPITLKMGNLTIYSAPPPGSGAILMFIMNVFRRLLPVDNENVIWQRMVETFKWAYARRTELGDPDFVESIGEKRNV